MYYTILTGQPPLRLQGTEQRSTLEQLKDIVAEAVSGRDARAVGTFFLRFDCLNLVHMLRKDASETMDSRGMLTHEQLEELLLGEEGTGWGVEQVPQFMRDFPARYRREANQPGWYAEDDILLQYYEFAIGSSANELAEWYRMNFNLQSLMTALVARRNGWRVADYVKGHGDLCDTLRNSSAPDFGLATQLPYVADIIKIAEETDPVRKEQQTDAFKWAWLDEHTFMEPFDIVALIAYLARTEMLDRWALLDVEQGRARFTEIIDNLRGEARVPEEFLRK